MKNLRQLLFKWFTDHSETYNHPFIQYGKLCATNGKLLIRIDKNMVSDEDLQISNIKEQKRPDTQKVIPQCTRCTLLTKKNVQEAIQKAAIVDEYLECDDCNGSGHVEYKYLSLSGNYYFQDLECPICYGTGKLEPTGKKIHDPLQIYQMEDFFLTGNTLAAILDVMNVFEVEQLFIRHIGRKAFYRWLMLTLDQTNSVEVVIGGIRDEDAKSIIKINTSRKEANNEKCLR